MQRKLYKKEERGLKGGPNYQVSEMTGSVTTTGYWPDSPDRNNDFNIIPSNEITMKGMDMPLLGISNKGDKKLMFPGKDYKFKGDSVTEFPIQGFNENVDWLGSKYRDIGVGASGDNFEVGLGNYIPYDTPTREGMVNPYIYGDVNIGKDRSLGINVSPDYTGISFKKEFNKGGIYLGAYKQVGGQLVPHDISVPDLSRQDGGTLETIFKQIVPNYGTQPSLIQEVASMPAEVSHIVKSRSYEPSEAYIQELMRQENEGNTGFRNNRYYPYDSVEGGTPTIGYGHKLTEKEVNSNKYAAGLTREDVEKLMRSDLRKHKDVARSAFENEYGKGTFNRLPDPLKDLVVDYSYTGTGIDKFPNFHKAVYEYSAAKDPALKQEAYEKMLAQYKRHTGKKELKKRNDYTEKVLRGLKQEGGATYDIPNEYYRAPNVVREEGREWYDPVSETIHMQPDYPNFTYEQLVKNHELEHHKQKLRGALSSTEYWPGPLKEPVVGASDEMIYPYYNRAGQDVRNLMNAAPQSTFFGIPEDVAVMGFQNKTYDVPGTAEYEAEYPNTPRTLYRGKPVAKNAIAKTLSREEKDPEMMFRDKYNTELTKEEQKEFDKWVEEESKKQGRDILMDKGAYDIQGFWKSGDWKNRDADNHGTDTWKKPNHPTFSNQSKYHGAGGWYGGNWTEDAGYQPSKQTLNNYGPDYYNWMFGEEPNRPEHLDMSRYDGTNSPIPVVYQKGGPAKRFNTKLRGQAAEAFNQHAQQFPSLINDAYDYDTRGFYKELYDVNNGDIDKITKALTPGSETAHVGTDRYKKPNHPTFSKESKYHVPILRPAGEWGHNEEGDYDYFNASRRNIKNMTESDGTPLDYFKRAEDYNQDGIPDVKLFYKGQPVFKEGGSVKKVKIKSLPKNWKSQ